MLQSTIYKTLKIYEENTSKFFINCSKGTYIRSLMRDIAYELKNLGFTSELKRTKIGGFELKTTP